MYREAPRGTNAADQSATRSSGHAARAELSARLKFAPRVRWIGRTLPSKATFTHSTGSPRVTDMRELITVAGYEDSPCESMSFVPSATTIAEIFLLRERWDLTTETASDTRRPRLWSMTVVVHGERVRNISPRPPRRFAPSVRLSPTTRSVPVVLAAGRDAPSRTLWPFTAPAQIEVISTAARSAPVSR